MADRSIKVKLEAEVAGYKKDLEGAAKATEKLAAAQELAAHNVTVAGLKHKEAANKVAAAEKQLKAAQDSGKASSEELTTAERKVAEAKRGHWQASNELKAAQESLTKANLAQSQSLLQQQSMWGKAKAFYKENRAEIDQVGASLTKLGAAGTVALGGAAKAAMDWESAWAGVTKTVDGTDAQMASLQRGLRDMAKELPSTHEEIAAVAEAAGQLGIETKNVRSFTRTMIDLGETTNMSADVAATQIARFTNIMGTSQTEVDRLGSTIVGLGNNFATTESEIMDMAMRLAGAGKQAGLTEADVLGIAAAMSSVGIEAEAGGSAMSLTMKRIAKEVETNGKNLGTFAKVAGMSATEFQQAWGQDAAGALTTFIAGLGNTERMGMSANQILSELGITGIRESDSLLRLSSANDLLAQSLGMSADAYEENIALAKEAEQRYATTESQVKMAWNSIKDAAIDAGQYILPVVADVTEKVAGLAQWFSDLPGPAKAAATGIGGVLTVSALAVGGGIKLVGTIADTAAAYSSLATKAPRAAKGIRAVTKYAGIATVALLGLEAAAAIAGSGLDEIGKPRDFENALKVSSEDVEAARLAIDELAKASGSGATEIRGIGDALKNVNRGGGMKALDWLGSMGGIFDSEIGLAKEAVKNFDDALSTLVQGGDFESAAQGFSIAASEASLQGVALEDVISKFPEYTRELQTVAADLGVAVTEQELLQWALEGTAPAAVAAAQATSEAGSAAEAAAPDFVGFKSSLLESAEAADSAFDSLMGLANGVLSIRDAKRGFKAAIDDATKALKENGKTLDRNTEAGRANEAALDKIASEGLRLLEQEREQGASQERLKKVMEQTRAEYIAMADSMGMSADKAAKLADDIGLLPEDVRMTAVFDSAAAEADAQALADTIVAAGQSLDDWTLSADGSSAISTVDGTVLYINDQSGEVEIKGDPDPALKQAAEVKNVIDRTMASIQVDANVGLAAGAINGFIAQQQNRTIRLNVSTSGASLGARPAFASGGSVFGPGTETSDSIPALLSNNEHVWSAKEVRGAGGHGVLERMRSLARAGKLPAFAKGGAVARDDRVAQLLKKDKQDVEAAKAQVKQRRRAENAAQKSYNSIDGKKENQAAKKAAKKRLDAAKKATKAAEKELKEARDQVAARRKELDELRSFEKSLTVDVRRGELQAQGTSGLSGAYGLVDQLRSASTMSGLTSKQSSTMFKSAVAAEKNFKALYAEADRLQKALDKAEGNLADMRSISAGIKSNLSGGFSLTDSIQDEAWDRGGRTQKRQVTGAGMLADAKAYQAKVKRLGARFKTLADWGASSEVLQEIASYGVDDGLLIAESLSKSQVQELTGVFAGISSASGYVGNQATRNYTDSSGTFYANGVYQAKDEVLGLRADMRENNKAIEKQTTSVINALGKPFELKYSKGQLTSIVKKKATGGWITGPGGPMDDRIPAMLSNGEFVTRAREAQKPANAALLERMNAGQDVHRAMSVSPQLAVSPRVVVNPVVNIDYKELGAVMASNPIVIENIMKFGERELARIHSEGRRQYEKLGVRA